MQIQTSTRGYELVSCADGEDSYAALYADYVLDEHKNAPALDHADGSVTDEKIGTRKVTDDTGSAVTKTLTEHLTGAYLAVKKERIRRGEALATESAARQMAVLEEAQARNEAIEAEKQAREQAIYSEGMRLETLMSIEKHDRKTAIEEEAAARQEADNGLNLAIQSLGAQCVKSVNGSLPDENGDVTVPVCPTKRTYSQCIVNGDFSRGDYGWHKDTVFSVPCTFTAPQIGMMEMTVTNYYNASSQRAPSNIGTSGEPNENYRYFLRVIISNLTEDSVEGCAFKDTNGTSTQTFTMTKKRSFNIGDATFCEYIGVCDNTPDAPYGFMMAPFKTLPTGTYTVLEQIAVEIAPSDPLYDATGDELYELFSHYEEGQYEIAE